MASFFGQDFFESSTSGSSSLGVCQLTSSSEIDQILSSVGSSLAQDDLSQTDALSYLGGVVYYASETILSFLNHHYDCSALSTSKMIRYMATIIACHEISIRRGNPGIFGNLLDGPNGIYATLQAMATLKRLIPGVGTRSQVGAGMPATLIDDRYRYSKQRVDRDNSVGTFPGQKDLAFPANLGEYPF